MAKDGIEPPTHGFSVPATLQIIVANSKIPKRFLAGRCATLPQPNPCRTGIRKGRSFCRGTRTETSAYSNFNRTSPERRSRECRRSRCCRASVKNRIPTWARGSPSRLVRGIGQRRHHPPRNRPRGDRCGPRRADLRPPRGPTALATYTDVDSENSCLRFGHCIPMRNIGSMPSLAALARLHQSVNVRGLRSGPEWIGAALAGGCMADRPLNCGHSLIIDSGLSQPSDQSKTGRGWLLTAADFEVPGRLSGSALGDITYPSDVKSWGPRCSKQSGNIGYSAVSSA